MLLACRDNRQIGAPSYANRATDQRPASDHLAGGGASVVLFPVIDTRSTICRHFSRLRWRSASFYLAANVNSAAAAGGFNRLLLLLSFMFRYSQWVVQEGEVVAGWLARRAESLRVRVRPILRCRKWSLCTRQWRMPRNSWDPEVHGCSED